MTRIVSLTLAAILLSLAGCGDNMDDTNTDETRQAGTDKQRAQQVAQAYVDALAAGNAADACQYLIGPCGAATEREIKMGTPIGADFGQVRSVRIQGNTARVWFSSGGFLALKQYEGDWKVGVPVADVEALGGQ